MFEIVAYSSEKKQQWDELVSRSRNGSFLFMRDYMDYHSDRYKDNSYLFFNKGKLEALLPANLENRTLYSHQGLTFGGVVVSSSISASDVLSLFLLLNQQLIKQGINKVVYKPGPYIYHRKPSQEDIYALFRLGATKTGCYISSTIFQNNKIGFTESRKSGIRKAMRAGLKVEQSDKYDLFWLILNSNLQKKYNKKPVHTLDEIMLLGSRFPRNIQLYVATAGEQILAGTILYIMDNIVHVQYMAASDQGRLVGALDVLFDNLINKIFLQIPIFDFGHSTENQGLYLNENLIFQKEGFGGRGIVYETYEYFIS